MLSCLHIQTTNPITETDATRHPLLNFRAQLTSRRICLGSSHPVSPALLHLLRMELLLADGGLIFTRWLIKAGDKGEKQGLKKGMEETKQAVAPLEGRADLLCEETPPTPPHLQVFILSPSLLFSALLSPTLAHLLRPPPRRLHVFSIHMPGCRLRVR